MWSFSSQGVVLPRTAPPGSRSSPILPQRPARRTFGIINALSQSGVIIGSMRPRSSGASGIALAMLAAVVPTFGAALSLLFRSSPPGLRNERRYRELTCKPPS